MLPSIIRKLKIISMILQRYIESVLLWERMKVFADDYLKRSLQIAGLLHDIAWQIVEAPANEHGKPVVLEGSDVLYTGKIIISWALWALQPS